MTQQRSSLYLISLLLLSLATASHAQLAHKIGHASDVSKAHSPNHVLVKISTGHEADVVLAGSRARHLFDRWYRIELPSDEAPERALSRFAENEGVTLTELEYLVSLPPLTGLSLTEPELKAALAPNDEHYHLQWNMPLIEMPAAWSRGRGFGSTVAIVDTGITSLGEDLGCHVFKDPFNAITGQAGPGVAEDDAAHGSHVAGTAGQCTNNGVGVTGLADATRLMPIKVLDANGDGSFANAAVGIEWAINHGADVINLSLGAACETGWPSCSISILNDAIDHAVAMDVVVVVAAGNRAVGGPFLSHPANHPGVIPVIAVDLEKNITSYSNYDLATAHSHVIAAPGGDNTVDLNMDGYVDGVLQETLGIGCGFPDDTAYCFFDGTSMATPHVAGAVAILKGLYPDATRDDIMQALEDSAEDLGSPGYDSFYGHGLLQVDQAIDALENLLEPSEPFTCIPGENVLCIAAHGDTYEVTMDWERDGSGGKAQAVDLGPVGITQGGTMAFRNLTNPEVLIKILDFCALGGSSYAVFFAATTDVAFTIKVRQASTGQSERYSNVEGMPALPVQDTDTRFLCP